MSRADIDNKSAEQPMVEKGEYSRLVSSAGTASVAVAATLIISKVIAYLITQSATILASLTDSVMDVFASIVNLIAIKYAVTPADNDHCYGHWKAESVASLMQCAFICGSAIFLLAHGVSRVLNPIKLASISIGMYVTLLAMLLTVLLCIFQTYVVKKTHSKAIAADRLHYASDLLFNFGVIISLGLSLEGYIYADGICSIALSLYILYGALHIGRDALAELLDKQLPKSDIIAITKIIKDVEGVQGVHDLRTRSSGPCIFIQAHLEIEKDLTLERAHAIADNCEAEILKVYNNADITMHMEPVVHSEAEYKEMTQ